MPTEIIFPRVDMDMVSGRISHWHAADGARVNRGDPLFEIETAKAAMEIEAAASGTVRRLPTADGEVPIGTRLGWILADGEKLPGGDEPAAAGSIEASPTAAGREKAAVEAAATDTAPVDPPSALRATPLARREAALRGIDLAALRGSGPNGRIVSSDLPSSAGPEARATGAEERRTAAAERVSAGADAVHRRWFGAATGRPVVFLHGFGADGSNWRSVAGHASAALRMLVLDLPGHGRSAMPGAFTLDALAERVTEAIEGEGLHEIDLVGHSLGGAVALSLAERHEVAIRSLTLLAPAGLGPEIDGAFLRGLNRAEREDSLAPWLRRLFADEAVATPGFVQATLRARADPALRRWQAELTNTLFPDGTQATSLRHVLAGLAVPTKVIWGTADRIIPAAHGGGLPPRVALHLARTGHLPHFEDPALVAALIGEAVRAGS